MLLVGATSVAGCVSPMRPEQVPSTVSQVAPTAERRPDVRAARLRLLAAVRRAEAAHLDSDPRPRAGGRLGLRSRGLSQLARSGSDLGQAALGFWTPFFPERHETPEALAAGAELEDAAAEYEQVYRRAARQIAAARTHMQILEARLAQARVALAAAEADYRGNEDKCAAGACRAADLLVSEVMRRECGDRLVTLEARRPGLQAELARAISGDRT